jgi:hypothetical protein
MSGISMMQKQMPMRSNSLQGIINYMNSPSYSAKNAFEMDYHCIVIARENNLVKRSTEGSCSAEGSSFLGIETELNRVLMSMWVEDFSVAGLLVVWGCWDLEFSLPNQILRELGLTE